MARRPTLPVGKRKRLTVVEATEQRVSELDDPDVALVALAFRLAGLLDDPDSASAAAAKEYRSTILALTAGAAREDVLDDLLDGD